MTVVFMFPSQTSRYAGMIRKVVGIRPESRLILDRASDILGEDLSRYAGDEAEIFKEKRDQRLGMFLVNHMYLTALQAEGIEGDLSLGFSLGEYNHLVHIGVLDFDMAIRLLVRPSPPDLPDPEGERAIVYRISQKTLEALVAEGSAKGLVEVSGMLSPHIHLIVGERPAVHAVMDLVKARVPRARAMTFPVKLPLHSQLLEPIGRRFRTHLETLTFGEATKPYLPNVLGEAVERPDHGTIVDLMSRHLYQPLRWRQSIDHIVANYPKPAFVEVGPRRALCGFLYLDSRWHPGARLLITDSMKVESARVLDKTIRDLQPDRPRFRLAAERFRGVLEGSLDPDIERGRKRLE